MNRSEHTPVGNSEAASNLSHCVHCPVEILWLRVTVAVDDEAVEDANRAEALLTD